MEISKQIVLVTGANRGLGRHLAQELLARGAKVYAGARNPETIDLPGAIPLLLDITNEKSVAAAAELANDVTILINNAGSYTGASLLNGELDLIRMEMDTHYFGTLSMIRAFAPVIEKNSGGAILNILSVLSWVSFDGAGAYAAAKSAEWSMTNALRQVLAPKNIRVSGLHVGYMDTDMTAGIQAPKSNPADIAKIAIRGIEADSYEIVADDLSRKVQQNLAGGVKGVYPQLF
ncbi:SDR family oxidoreductase [Paenibacillus cremeus]|uniref:SDR family oxidoreductase n=1 Tax=Paenibacillus cremeus TaxID=2163881 RepID=A0A559K0G5_9BACL|nr:SDR family oxidoreductase [Paenibacillus cremeus]TVY05577.1 SDR family oxidoreductase [Paenibacillus cremeus]